MIDPFPQEIDLTDAQVHLLRRYKRSILQALNFKEKLYCRVCAEAGRPEGVRAAVTDDEIVIRCRCRHRVSQKKSST
jgi:hypothetical protein